MQRSVWCAVLLGSLMGAATAAQAADAPAHAWPVQAAAESAPVRREFVPALETGRLTDGSVQTLKRILAQPAPRPTSLVQINLSRRVRLAILSVPRWTPEVGSRHLTCVPLLSLEW